jgi:hypothetical protein
MSFDVAKWNKKRYLTEAGITEADIIGDRSIYDQCLDIVIDYLREANGDDAAAYLERMRSFITNTMVTKVQEGQTVHEGPYDTEGITADNIDKVDISFKEGSQRLHGVYIYLKGGNGMNWDKKLSTQEFQNLLDMLGIDIDFKSNPFDKADQAINALEDKGYKVTTSDFDAS